MGTGSVPIGLTPELKFNPPEPLSLPPGCMAVILTDGIPEANDAARSEFGVERILPVIRAHHASPASEIISHLRQEVLQFMGTAEQTDDQTIVVCKRLE